MIEEKLDQLGIVLPTPPKPAGSYIPVVTTGNLAFVS
ncbi:MAG TPA: RidA family protein, partial [Candidatus Nitrosotenuis sp.]|nr:RidA family protein [Candidatus Nitrosotenuis sp.]